MKPVLALLIALMLPSFGGAYADGFDADDRKLLLEQRRKGKILPLFDILQRVKPVTGEDIAEIEFEQENQQLIYEIYFITPEGLRREIKVNAKSGRILPEKTGN